MTFVPYIAKDRAFQNERFDFLIADEAAKGWYDETAEQFMPERAWCRQHIRSGETVIDCGAHHGMMSVLFGRWVGRQGSVIAYEPLAANAAVVAENARLSGLTNLIVRPVGVSDEVGAAAVDLNGNNIVVNDRGGTVFVEMVRLDDDLPADMVVHFLKIDVEGSELRALLGARRVLKQRPTIALELHNLLFADRRKTLARIMAILSPAYWKYDVLGEVLSPHFRHFEGPVDLEWLASFDNPHIFCIPRRRVMYRHWLLAGRLASPIRRFNNSLTASVIRSLFRDPLGTVWTEEESGWSGIWTRRGKTTVFDALWTKDGATVTAVLTMTLDDGKVTVIRTRSNDGAADLSYAGTVIGLNVSGRYPGGRWSATIRHTR
jgi:FkbM family methyltransferase